MAMTATKGPRGQELATATCCECEVQSSVPASHTHHGAMARGGKMSLRLMNEGQALKKFEKAGWALVANKLRCPSCETKRKAREPKHEAKPVKTIVANANVTEAPREPSARMTAQIVGLLEDAYDDKAKRYRNPSDNDKSIADVIGGGCLWGWVAAIREKEFGPDTRNAEMDAVRAEVRKLDGRISAAIGEIRAVEAVANELRSRLDKIA